MVPKEFIFAGLMNPGEKYRYTRHNAGAMALDLIFPEAGYTPSRTLDAWLAEARWRESEVVLLKPQTFMNLSGQSVAKAIRHYKLTPKQLVVLHDEVELPTGEVRYKFGGGHKGHNGLRSIMSVLGSGDFHRIRIGVGRPQDDANGIADYLLSFQPKEERAALPALTSALNLLPL